jgi:predicted Fe-S protein YdhL (DUF1289 family)
MPSYRAEYIPAGKVPDNSLLHCGRSEAGWEPGREGRPLRPDGLPMSAVTGKRELQPGETCDVCHQVIEDEDGSELVVPYDADPIEVLETAVIICAGCGRATYENRLWGRVFASNPEAVSDRSDQADRTGAAVKAANPSAAAVPGQPQKTLTRRERRARQFGHDKTATGS